MRYPVILKPDAERDLVEGLAWYNAQRAGLGEEFLAEVDDALDRLAENPRLCAIVHRDVRRALTRRFPYGVFFVLENDAIIVLAILHAKRDPARWQRRR